MSEVCTQKEREEGCRRVYSDPSSSRYLDSSVKASFIIAIVPNVPETYFNVKQLLDNLGLENLKHSAVSDIKLCQIICGLSPSSMATRPCYICEWKRDDPFKQEPMRTLGSLRSNNENYTQAGSKKVKAKEFYNCINPSS